jgi:hypothetical protein
LGKKSERSFHHLIEIKSLRISVLGDDAIEVYRVKVKNKKEEYIKPFRLLTIIAVTFCLLLANGAFGEDKASLV